MSLRNPAREPGRDVVVLHKPSFPELLNEDLFRDAILRERRRADRFEQPFVLILISLGRVAGQPRWERLVELLSQTKFDADVLGWFDEGSTVGLIRTVGDRDAQETATALADTIRSELARSMTGEAAAGCSIRLEIYSPKTDAAQVLFEVPDTRDRRRGARHLAKRILDIAGSLALLIVFSPVFLIVSGLVKLTSKGPVFFGQQRIGHTGRPFTMLKFRTMHVNADPAIHRQYVERFISSSNASGPSENVVFKIVDDPRVTRVGRVLRKSSLDEFPQFWNVLKGEMSLVGPRPPLAYEVAQYRPWHRRRLLDAKPGITGLWQVTGRSRTSFDEMVRLDLRYARSSSLKTDLKILLATPRAVLSGKGAH
jgi:lipopolysaccharide/colanic/teichoic acid biosynthesis glycosyltransferase